MDEESFPRGGKKKQHKTFADDANKDDLFSEELPTSENKEKKGFVGQISKQGKGKHVKAKTDASQAGQEQPHALAYKELYPGMLLLGCVKVIRNYDMILALPNGLTGVVSITNVSQAYTDSLQQYSQAQAQGLTTDDESVHTLMEMFPVGMIIPCKLLQFDDDNQKRKVTLSINPQEVNQSISAGNLKNNMYLYGSISSVEDHGYTVDLGIKGVTAFLKNTNAETYIRQNNSGKDLMIGQCLKCKLAVKSGCGKHDVNRVVTVTLNTDAADASGMVDRLDVPFSALVPGMKVKVKIDKVSDEGLIVSFRTYRGLIHDSHIPGHINNYSVGDEVVCCLLFVHPLSKNLIMTALPHLVNNQSSTVSLFESVSIGDKFENAKVKRVEPKRGVYFRLDKSISGFATLKNLSDGEVENLQEQFQKGSLHRARVLDHLPMENMVQISTKQSVLEQKYMTVADVQPGDLVHCTVTKIQEKGVLVTLQKNLKAFIPLLHLADVTLKHPEKKFKLGEKLKCRVLLVNLAKSSLTLTHKKSLVQSKFPMVSDYGQIQRGQILEGFICSIKDFGVHVKFYGNVQGLVPRPHLSSEPIQFPEKVFYRGQVVRSRVTHVDPAEERLKLSLVLEGKTEFGQKEADAPEDFEIGKLVKCKVLEKTEKGIDVELLPSKKKAFLPKIHLSDCGEMCQALLDAYQPGNVLQEVMYLSKTNVVIVTRKQCFIQATKNREIIHEFDRLQPGMELPGSVKNVMPYGMFVQFAGQLFGLVPNHLVADRKVADISRLYSLGQSVVAKVVEVNKEKQRFLATLRMADCCQGDTRSGVEILGNYFADRFMALKLFRKQKGLQQALSELNIGQVCKMTVNEVADGEVLGSLENGVKVFAIPAHVEGKIEVGTTIDSAVLDIDLVNRCAEVTLLPRLVKELGNKDSTLSHEKVKPSVAIQGEVILVKRDYTLFKLKAPAAGQLAYLASKQHLNDVLDSQQFHIGEVYLTVVERVTDPVIYVSLKGKKVVNTGREAKPHGSSALEKAEFKWSPAVKSFSDVSVGQIVEGLIIKYTKTGIIIRLGFEVHGCVLYERIRKGYTLVRGKSVMPIGRSVTVKVLQKSAEKDHGIELSMLKEDTGVELDLPQVALKSLTASKTVFTEESDKNKEKTSNKKRKRKNSETKTIQTDSNKKDLCSKKVKDNSEEKNKKDKRKVTVSEKSTGEIMDVCSKTTESKSSKNKRKLSDSEKTEGDTLGGDKKKTEKARPVVEGEQDSPKKPRKAKQAVQKEIESDLEDSDSGVEIKTRKSLNTQTRDKPVLELSEGFTWVSDFKLPTAADNGYSDSSDESDTDDKRPIKKTKAERRQEKLEEEKRLYELERKQLEGEQQPETADDFDRLVLQSPDSSLVWLRFMAFHLETSEIDKARAVAERALKTISFREEQEKVNVWVAYLNLENMYGSSESLNKVLARAVQQNDPVKINLQMITIYQKSDKAEEAERLFNSLMKKSSGEKDLWLKFGHFYFEQGRLDSARKLLQRALKSLQTKFHVETISRFAQLEFRLGEPERGKTMFENILSTYPGRTDLWSVYIDMVTKLKDHEATRALYNRVINMKIGAKKMKFFFKKFLSFEENFGSPQQIADIKKKALEYVEAQGYVDE